MDLEQALGQIDWDALECWSGAGRDLPAHLRVLAGSDRAAALNALADVSHQVFGSGEDIWPSTAAVVPFFWSFALDRRSPVRFGVLQELVRFADCVGEYAALGPLEDEHADLWLALTGGAVELGFLLADPDVEVRGAAVTLLGLIGEERHRDVVFAAASTESEPQILTRLERALSDLTLRWGGDLPAALRDWDVARGRRSSGSG